MKALLMLEDGWCCECISFTGEGEAFGELVFNTGLTGYQEIITDPSYHGQIVMMTNTMIGNYGIRHGESESIKIHAKGFIVKEYSGEGLDPKPSRQTVSQKKSPEYDSTRISITPTDFSDKISRNSAGQHGSIKCSLSDFLHSQNVPGVEGVDTRALTKHIREHGAMKAGISTKTLDREKLLDMVVKSPGLTGRNLVDDVTTGEPYLYSRGNGFRVAVLDCGVKRSILDQIACRDCTVEVFPSSAEISDIMRTKPDGVVLSNGPGDPAPLKSIIGLVDRLIEIVPVFGICLGHQIMAQALGAKTYKLKFGHHGGNHPVRDEKTGKIYITSQNHGFAVDQETLNKKDTEITIINLNDHTLEGFKHKRYPLFSVQFHPEAGPGPHDTKYYFDDFILMLGNR
jgi:carbamoyl-phosphate synthase small subunit